MNKSSRHNIEQPLGRILSHTGRSFLALINEKLSHLDIDRNFYALLLIEQGQGQITQQDLAGLLHSDKVTMVRIVNYLSEAGYVTRGKHNTDKRKYSLILTEKAKKDLPKIKKALSEITNVAFKGLSALQIDEFTHSLSIIYKNLNK